MTQRIPSRYHRIDGWRGYSIPGSAIAGVSDTGTYHDSPCPTPKVMGELRRFRAAVLKPLGIKSRIRFGQSSNLFCGKRWLCVDANVWPKAYAAANKYIAEHNDDYHYLHPAN